MRRRYINPTALRYFLKYTNTKASLYAALLVVRRVLHDLGLEMSALVDTAHLRDVGGMSTPFRRSSWCSFVEHAIDLFETETLGLRDEEVCVDERTRAKSSPNEEHTGSEVALIRVHHVWCDDGDDSVPEPVGRGGKSNSAGANADGEDLTDDYPGTRSPSSREEEDEEANERYLSVDSRDVVRDCCADSVDDVGLVETDSDTDDGNNELADQHAEGTPDEEWATSNSLDRPEGDRSRQHVDEGEDEGDQERVLNGTGRLQERS